MPLINKIVTIAACILVAVLVFALIQMLFTSSYHVAVLRANVFIAYGMSFCLLALLAERFFSWYRFNHNSVILTYAIATSMIAINSIIAIIYLNAEFNDAPALIRPKQALLGGFSLGSPIYSSAYFVTSFMSFVLVWIATVFLMRHYSERIGKTKYWIMVVVPLVYFLSQFQPLFLISFVDFRISDPVLFGILYTLIFAMSKPIGGLLFCIPFWELSRRLSNQVIRTYMIISAIGIVLLFTSNQPTGLALLPYPPYGIVTISFMALASYLLFIGIFSASFSISQDSLLRRYIRSVGRDANFIDVIGTAEMEQEIERKVTLFSKKKTALQEETGVSALVNEEDMKKYLDEVLREVHKSRTRD